MTTPRYFTDPLSGASYPFKGRLTSASVNGILTGLRALDYYTFYAPFTLLDGGITQIGGCVHEQAGAIILLSTTAWVAVPIATPGAATGFLTDTLPGGPTLSGPVRGAYNGAGSVVFVSAGYAYHFPASMVAARNAFASLTTARDVLWSEYGSQFIAVGGNGSSYGTVEVSANGTSWTAQANAESTAHTYTMVASDSTGRYILAAPSAGDDWAYSDNGGATWTKVTVAVDGDAAITPTGLAYDDSRSLWLMTVQSTSFTGNAARVWTTATPTTGPWAASGVDVPGYGLLGSSTSLAAQGIVAVGSEWLVGVGENTYGNLVVTGDAGATWSRSLGIPKPNAGSSRHYLRRDGGYLLIGEDDAPAEYISGRLWP